MLPHRDLPVIISPAGFSLSASASMTDQAAQKRRQGCTRHNENAHSMTGDAQNWKSVQHRRNDWEASTKSRYSALGASSRRKRMAWDHCR
jgi:hypothetical protein